MQHLTHNIFIAVILLGIGSQVMADDTLRCGTRLVQKGDLAIQVQEKCGKPVSKEIIGYTLRQEYKYQTNRQREYKVEQWIYGPYSGYYQEIIFEAGKVKKINRINN